MCVSVCVCIRSEKFGGRNMAVTCNLHTYYTLYCVCMITSDTLEEQQLKRMQSDEADTVWSDHVRLVLTRDTSYRTRCQSRGLCQTHTDMVKEVR